MAPEELVPHPIYTFWAEQILAALPASPPNGVVVGFLENILRVRAAKDVQAALTATATMIGDSASEFGPKLDRLNLELGETKAKIETAGVRISHATNERAQQISNDLQRLTTSLERASDQSSRLGRYLNILTAALVLAAVLTAGATAFQAYETKRQEDFTEQRLRQEPQVSPPTKIQPSATSPAPTPPHGSDTKPLLH